MGQRWEPDPFPQPHQQSNGARAEPGAATLGPSTFGQAQPVGGHAWPVLLAAGPPSGSAEAHFVLCFLHPALSPEPGGGVRVSPGPGCSPRCPNTSTARPSPGAPQWHGLHALWSFVSPKSLFLAAEGSAPCVESCQAWGQPGRELMEPGEVPPRPQALPSAPLVGSLPTRQSPRTHAAPLLRCPGHTSGQQMLEPGQSLAAHPSSQGDSACSSPPDTPILWLQCDGQRSAAPSPAWRSAAQHSTECPIPLTRRCRAILDTGHLLPSHPPHSPAGAPVAARCRYLSRQKGGRAVTCGTRVVLFHTNKLHAHHGTAPHGQAACTAVPPPRPLRTERSREPAPLGPAAPCPPSPSTASSTAPCCNAAARSPGRWHTGTGRNNRAVNNDTKHAFILFTKTAWIAKTLQTAFQFNDVESWRRGFEQKRNITFRNCFSTAPAILFLF